MKLKLRFWKVKEMLRLALRRAGRRIPDALLDKDTAAMRRMAALLGPGDIAVDLGAHVGNASIEFAHVAKKVYSYEPNPEIFRVFSARTRNYRNIHGFNMAVSDKAGHAKLYFEASKPGRYFEGSTIMKGKSNIGYGTHHEVDVAGIVDVLDLIGENVAIIKMDIEGAEYRVLDALIESGRMDQIEKIYIECHADRIEGLAEHKARTLAAAEKAGYRDKLDFTWP